MDIDKFLEDFKELSLEEKKKTFNDFAVQYEKEPTEENKQLLKLSQPIIKEAIQQSKKKQIIKYASIGIMVFIIITILMQYILSMSVKNLYLDKQYEEAGDRMDLVFIETFLGDTKDKVNALYWPARTFNSAEKFKDNKVVNIEDLNFRHDSYGNGLLNALEECIDYSVKAEEAGVSNELDELIREIVEILDSKNYDVYQSLINRLNNDEYSFMLLRNFHKYSKTEVIEYIADACASNK